LGSIQRQSELSKWCSFLEERSRIRCISGRLLEQNDKLVGLRWTSRTCDLERGVSCCFHEPIHRSETVLVVVRRLDLECETNTARIAQRMCRNATCCRHICLGWVSGERCWTWWWCCGAGIRRRSSGSIRWWCCSFWWRCCSCIWRCCSRICWRSVRWWSLSH
uniref:MSP domain-containing protein n=1 Tax=Parascaris univalens TaxID=6257 RepID=A0A915AP13_PARUN